MNLRAILLAVFLASSLSPPVDAQDFAVGADVSYLRQAEQQGIKFKENGISESVLEMLKHHGYTWIRLRLFHTPIDLPNNLEYTIASAQAAKRLGFRLLLDFITPILGRTPPISPPPRPGNTSSTSNWSRRSLHTLVTRLPHSGQQGSYPT